MATDDLQRPVVTDTLGKAVNVVAARAAAIGTTTAGESVAAAPAGSAMGNGSGNAGLPDGHMDGIQHPAEPPCAAVHVRYPRPAHCSQLILILSFPLFDILAELTRSCVYDIECLRVGNATVTSTFTPL